MLNNIYGIQKLIFGFIIFSFGREIIRWVEKIPYFRTWMSCRTSSVAVYQRQQRPAYQEQKGDAQKIGRCMGKQDHARAKPRGQRRSKVCKNLSSRSVQNKGPFQQPKEKIIIVFIIN